MANEALLAQVSALGGAGLLVLLVVLAVLVAPVFLVMFSKRVHGGRKLLWVVLMGTFSWLAWPAYAVMVRRSAKEAASEEGAS